MVTDANQCMDSNYVNVLVRPLPTVDAGLDAEMCLDDTISIGGSPTASGAQEPYSYSWSPDLKITDLAVENPKVSPTYSNPYRVLVVDAYGCKNIDTIKVKVNKLPSADAGLDKEICYGDTVAIGGNPSASSGTAPYSYLWSGGGLLIDTEAKPQANPNITTQYFLKVVDDNGCMDKDDVTIVVNMLPVVDAGTNIDFCFNETAIIGGNSTAQGDNPPFYYKWSPQEKLDSYSISNPTTNTTTNRYYSVLVTDNKGCQQKDSIFITVNPLPKFVVTGIDTIKTLKGSEEFHILGDQNNNYTFQPDEDSLVWRNDTLFVYVSPAGNTVYSIMCENPFTRCYTNQAIEIIYDPYTGMDPGVFERLSVYPNPTGSLLNIETVSKANKVHISLTDITGKVMQLKECNQGTITEKLDLSSLASGVYILELNADGYLETIKIVKN